MMDDGPSAGAPPDLPPGSGERDARPHNDGGADGGGAHRSRRRGRRPVGEDTRGAIVTAALTEFGRRGYDGTTLRGVARAAGVDARLVHHYFEGKEDLFVA